MSTGYGWEGIRQVCATLLGARHVPERLRGGACLQRGAITSVRPFYLFYHHSFSIGSGIGSNRSNNNNYYYYNNRSLLLLLLLLLLLWYVIIIIIFIT